MTWNMKKTCFSLIFLVIFCRLFFNCSLYFYMPEYLLNRPFICILDLILRRKCNQIITAEKSVLKIVEMQNLVVKCWKCGKYRLWKFTNFAYYYITHWNCHHNQAENGNNFHALYRWKQSFQTLQAYIFLILQHFPTKAYIFTHISSLYSAGVI